MALVERDSAAIGQPIRPDMVFVSTWDGNRGQNRVSDGLMGQSRDSVCPRYANATKIENI